MDAEKPDPTQNSDPNNRLHPEDDDIKFEVSKKQEGSSKECVTSPSSSASSSVTEESVVKLENGVVSAGEEDQEENDGFRTPTTSAKHRIPVVTECPPAPKKPKSRKRQVAADDSPADTRKRINLSEEEFRALFSPPAFSDFGKEVEKTGACGAV